MRFTEEEMDAEARRVGPKRAEYREPKEIERQAKMGEKELAVLKAQNDVLRTIRLATHKWGHCSTFSMVPDSHSTHVIRVGGGGIVFVTPEGKPFDRFPETMSLHMDCINCTNG